MQVEIIIDYRGKTRDYKVEGTSQWLPAWNYTTEGRISDFGFMLDNSDVFIDSVFTLITVNPLDYNGQYNMTIDGNTAKFSDYFDNFFNQQENFRFQIIYEDGQVGCLDVNGKEVKSVSLGDDGVVYSVDEASSYSANLSSECCESFGFEYDITEEVCYWSKPCENNDVIKLVINPEGNDGVLFQVDEGQNCVLDVEFDYLLDYDCAKLLQCKDENNTMLDILASPTITMTLDKVVNGVNTTILERDLYNVTDMVSYLNGNFNTGLFLNSGNKAACTAVRDMVASELGGDVTVLNETSLGSYWVHFRLEITDAPTLALIKNQKIRLGVRIANSPCNMSLLMDNIEFNRRCELIFTEETKVTKCPSFELARVTDNKKSWVANETEERREFNLTRRETDYKIKHHKLGLNSKEIELNMSPANAIETDLMNSVLNIPCLLEAMSGLLTTNIYQSNLSLEEFNTILVTELIDAKSRKVLSAYPLLRMLYDNYMASLELCGIATGQYDYINMDEFIHVIGRYWVDLIEQVIPATTIWGSTYKYSNTIFDSDKFQYKRGTLFTCASPTDYPLTPIGSDNTVEVITTTLTTGSTTEQKCTGVYMIQTDDSSEFIGSVKVIGGKGAPSFKNFDSGDIIILNEAVKSALQKR